MLFEMSLGKKKFAVILKSDFFLYFVNSASLLLNISLQSLLSQYFFFVLNIPNTQEPRSLVNQILASMILHNSLLNLGFP